jgi:hypothetical protein
LQIGDRILAAAAAATGDPAAVPADLPFQRIAILGSVTTDYLARAVAGTILVEDTALVVYRAPFSACSHDCSRARPLPRCFSRNALSGRRGSHEHRQALPLSPHALCKRCRGDVAALHDDGPPDDRP